MLMNFYKCRNIQIQLHNHSHQQPTFLVMQEFQNKQPKCDNVITRKDLICLKAKVA